MSPNSIIDVQEQEKTPNIPVDIIHLHKHKNPTFQAYYLQNQISAR